MRFPAVPGAPGASDLDSESAQTGSSVDAPPRPQHTTPDSHFGTEVSLYLGRNRVCVPTLCVKAGLGLVLTGFSLTAIWCLHPFLQNVLRIHVLEAQDLIAKDRFLGGLVKGKSDPYVKLKLAGRSFRSRVVREDLNPRWNEVFEVRIEWLGLLPVLPHSPHSLRVVPKALGSADWMERFQSLGEESPFVCTLFSH